MSEETDEEQMEKECEENGKRLFNQMIIWLSQAEIDFKVVSWESGEGRDIVIADSSYLSLPYLDDGEGNIIKRKPTTEIRIGFFTNGHISFETEKLEQEEKK